MESFEQEIALKFFKPRVVKSPMARPVKYDGHSCPSASATAG